MREEDGKRESAQCHWCVARNTGTKLTLVIGHELVQIILRPAASKHGELSMSGSLAA